jgi:hypothetical protein
MTTPHTQSPLQPGWTECRDEKDVWYAHESGTTTWERPSAISISITVDNPSAARAFAPPPPAVGPPSGPPPGGWGPPVVGHQTPPPPHALSGAPRGGITVIGGQVFVTNHNDAVWVNPSSWNDFGCYFGVGDTRAWVPNPYACGYSGHVPKVVEFGPTCTLFTPFLGGLYCGCCIPVTVNRANCGQYVAIMLVLQLPFTIAYLFALRVF